MMDTQTLTAEPQTDSPASAFEAAAPNMAAPVADTAYDTMMEGSSPLAEQAILEVRRIIASLQEPRSMLDVVHMLPEPYNTPDVIRDVETYVVAELAVHNDLLNDKAFQQQLVDARLKEADVEEADAAVATAEQTSPSAEDALILERMAFHQLGALSLTEAERHAILEGLMVGPQPQLSIEEQAQAALQAVIAVENTLTEPSTLLQVLETALPDPDMREKIGGHFAASYLLMQNATATEEEALALYTQFAQQYSSLPPTEKAALLASIPAGPQPELEVAPGADVQSPAAQTEAAPPSIPTASVDVPPAARDIPSVTSPASSPETEKADANHVFGMKEAAISGLAGLGASAAATGAMIYDEVKNNRSFDSIRSEISKLGSKKLIIAGGAAAAATAGTAAVLHYLNQRKQPGQELETGEMEGPSGMPGAHKIAAEQRAAIASSAGMA